MKRVIALLAAGALVLGSAARQAAAQAPGFDPSSGYGYLPDGYNRLAAFAEAAPPAASPQPMSPNGVNGVPLPSPNYALPADQQAEFFGPEGRSVAWQIIGEYLYLRPSNAEVAYGQVVNSAVPGALVSPPFGQTGVTNPFYDTGFRVSAARALGEGAAIGVSYTNFDTHVQSGLDVFGLAPLQIASLVLYPGAPAGANPSDNLMVANERIRFQLGDIDYKVALVNGPRYCANLVVGARFLMLNQHFDSREITAAGLIDDVLSNVNFEGGGIRAGFEGERQSPSSGFLVYGKSIASLVAGTVRADYEQVDSVSGGTVVLTQWKSDRVVSILDLEVGAGWASQNGRIRITGGWMVSGWFNTVKLSDYIHAVQDMGTQSLTNAALLAPANPIAFKIDREVTKPLVFDGLVGRVEVRF